MDRVCRWCEYRAPLPGRQYCSVSCRREAARERRLMKLYGISIDDYNQMLGRQGGRCALCGRKGRLVVDHHHGTGEVRSLLHRSCNRDIIGALDAGGPDAYDRAIALLTRYKSGLLVAPDVA